MSINGKNDKKKEGRNMSKRTQYRHTEKERFANREKMLSIIEEEARKGTKASAIAEIVEEKTGIVRNPIRISTIIREKGYAERPIGRPVGTVKERPVEIRVPKKRGRPKGTGEFKPIRSDFMDRNTTDMHLTRENVLINYDSIVRSQTRLRDSDIDEGKYWIISCNEQNIDGRLRPFLLLARINNRGEIAYLQGVWLRDNQKRMIEKQLSPNYIDQGTFGKHLYVEIDIIDGDRRNVKRMRYRRFEVV